MKITYCAEFGACTINILLNTSLGEYLDTQNWFGCLGFFGVYECVEFFCWFFVCLVWVLLLLVGVFFVVGLFCFIWCVCFYDYKLWLTYCLMILCLSQTDQTHAS